MSRLREIAGVVIDLDQVPDKDEPAESHVRLTGEVGVREDGTEIPRARMHAGPGVPGSLPLLAEKAAAQRAAEEQT